MYKSLLMEDQYDRSITCTTSAHIVIVDSGTLVDSNWKSMEAYQAVTSAITITVDRHQRVSLLWPATWITINNNFETI